MGMFDSLFKAPKAPEMPKITDDDVRKNLALADEYNQKGLAEWQRSTPELTQFMQNLFNQSSMNTQNALDKNYTFGTELQEKGYTSAMGDYMKMLQSESLAAGAASGMPVGSAFTANLGAGIGAQQLLSNQLQGTNVLAQTANQQADLNKFFMKPSLSLLGNTQVNPTAFLNLLTYNNQIDQQNAMIRANNNASNSWFDNLVGGTVGSIINTPFSLVQQSGSLVGNAPGLAGGWFGSMFGNIGGLGT